MAENLEQLPNKWTESDVRTWLRSFEVKEEYIKKLYEEEVNGQILLTLDEDFLRTSIGMKLGPAHLVIKKRNELIKSLKKSQEKKMSPSGIRTELESKTVMQKAGPTNDPNRQILEDDQNERQNAQQQLVVSSKEDCKARPFDQDPDVVYGKHRILPPESGAFNLISPCREFKSLQTAIRLDRTRLQSKFAREVLKFAIGCMNTRTNGTIYFGVMDSKEDQRYAHGEIIGIPVREKDIYVDALRCYEKSFSSNKEQVHQCVRPPRFIEVMDRESTEKRYVVEVDIVPSISIVKDKVFKVRLPKFNESTNKLEYEKETILRRMGPETKSVTEEDQCVFFDGVKDRDAQRQEAETRKFFFTPEIHQNLGRKLTMLITSGKKLIENDKWFLLVTNKARPDDLCNIDWLLNLNIFCVFDFDPDSEMSGLCGEYLQHHPSTNKHSLKSYRISDDTSITEFISNMHLFDQTSWIFCNGRTDFKGHEPSCDEMTWTKTKLSLLRESVSVICKQIFPKGTFQVIFLLTSPVEKPLLYTWDAFFTEMQGHEDIMCVCESEEIFQKWQSFAEGLCQADTVNNHSVVGMKMSHINATLKQIQNVTSRTTKHLSTFAKGECCLETQAKDKMYSLEIVTADHCDETTKEYVNTEKNNIEGHFYHGGKVTWLNFWLAEREYVGKVIERDAYNEVCKLLDDLKLNTMQSPVNRINIYHHPGSGGSTVARQVLWNKRKDLRCAVVKPSYSPDLVAKHAVELREHDEKDPQKCLPVLLLIEDSEQEYLDDLRYELEEAIHSRKIHYEKPCFIVLTCRRSHNPEKKTTESPLENVSVSLKLSAVETSKFARKQQALEEQYSPQFILTFVLMNNHFKISGYVKDFVTHLLQGIDRKSVDTRLLLYVALMNTYVQNSFISLSHCEAFLGLTAYIEQLRHPLFENSLTQSTHLLFVQLRDEKTYFESVKIIHPKIAEEILKQLLGDQEKRGSLAKELLREKVLLEHRFGKETFWAFLRALLMKRSRVSRGDENDTLFSPLIEHVRKNESQDLAIELLKDAYHCFHKDAFFAQHISRLYYCCENFEEAKQWAETAATLKPNNSYILDTKGQVYKRWFEAKLKAFDNDDIPKTAKSTAAAVEIAVNAMECFKHCQQVAVAHPDTMNRLGFFAELQVGCKLLELMLSLREFADRDNGRMECMKYLTVTDYIPVEVKDAWEPFHDRLKKLHKTMNEALQWISEDLSFFQTDVVECEEEASESPEEATKHPLKFLAETSSAYGKYFSGGSWEPFKSCQPIPTNASPFKKRMMIHQLGGGNVTSIFFKLTNQQEKDAVPVLEAILSLYPRYPLKANLLQNDIVNYIATNIALNCLSPRAPQVARLKDLQALSHHLPSDKRKCSPTAHFLLTLLFWPDDHDTEQEKDKKYETVQSAVEYLNKDYWTKMKDIPQRKRRLYTHFFLGEGNGLDKFVQKSKFESVTEGLSVNAKRMKWFHGEVWKMPEVAKMLKSVSGWTQNGDVYLEGPRKERFKILPVYLPSVPHGNENITFYLGFTFRGPVAYNITVKE